MLKIILFILIYVWVLFMLYSMIRIYELSKCLLLGSITVTMSKKLLSLYKIIVHKMLSIIEFKEFNVLLTRTIYTKEDIIYTIDIDILDPNINKLLIKDNISDLTLNIVKPEIVGSSISDIYKRIKYAKKFIKYIESDNIRIDDEYKRRKKEVTI